MSNWVSVKDKLPEHGVRVLAHTGTFFQSYCVAKLDRDFGTLNSPVFWDTSTGLFIDDVTHWMPLPEPPK